MFAFNAPGMCISTTLTNNILLGWQVDICEVPVQPVSTLLFHLCIIKYKVSSKIITTEAN